MEVFTISVKSVKNSFKTRKNFRYIKFSLNKFSLFEDEHQPKKLILI